MNKESHQSTDWNPESATGQNALARLLEEVELADGDGRFPKVFRAITETELMIIDDWGPDTLTAAERRDLMDIVEVRYGRAVPT